MKRGAWFIAVATTTFTLLLVAIVIHFQNVEKGLNLKESPSVTNTVSDGKHGANNAESYISKKAYPVDDVKLLDVPQEITDLFVKKTIYELLVRCHAEVLEAYLNEKTEIVEHSSHNLKAISIKDKEKIELYVANARAIIDSTSEGDYLEPYDNPEINFHLEDPRRLEPAIAELQNLVDEKYCSELAILDANATGREAEIHNFLVYFITNVLNVCDKSVEWPLTEVTNPYLREFYNQFSSEDSFGGINLYLANPRNRPFEIKKSEFFTCYYMEYARLAAFRNPGLVLQEFFYPRDDLKKRYPELQQLEDILWRSKLVLHN